MIAVIYLLFMMCGIVTIHNALDAYDKNTMSRDVLRAYVLLMGTLMSGITMFILIRGIVTLVSAV